jgi:hypothetical protein
MRGPGTILLAAMVGCGSGSANQQFQLELSTASESRDAGASRRIEMQAGDTLGIEMLVVGSVPGPVTFTAEGLPSFATLNGPLLELATARSDAGEFSFTVSARSGHSSSSVVVHLTVNRFNNPPRWVLVFPQGMIGELSDDMGNRGSRCPGPETCRVSGAPTVLVGDVSDPDGDAVRMDVEVVSHGQPFTGRPTFSAASHGGIHFPQLPAGVVYDYAIRVVDAYGAVAPTLYPSPSTPDGWLHLDFWGFEQGPCGAGEPCACWNGGGCNADADCCSGKCIAGDPSSLLGGQCQ